MDKILTTKPVAKLEHADKDVQAYVLLLEKELKHWIVMKGVNDALNKQIMRTVNELEMLKQKNHVEQNKALENSLKLQKSFHEADNSKLKQQIMMLQNEVQQLKNCDGTQATTSNTKKTQQIHLNSIAANNDPNANCVLVKGFSEKQLHRNLKINITYLGRQMNLKILEKDVIKVTTMERKYYERHNLKPNKLILIVQFGTPELKVDFLKNKEKLRADLKTQELEIIDYVSDEVYNLYQYAKVLKTCGYAQIYWRNNCVYAKKTRSTYCEPVLIKTKNDVDVLKSSM